MKTQTESQEAKILAHLKSGRSLTPYQALTSYDCFRLSARIHRLRERGHEIETEMKELSNKKIVARYFIKTESK